jgi:PBP1b-binding outer membrane lipoprotein LpoB
MIRKFNKTFVATVLSIFLLFSGCAMFEAMTPEEEATFDMTLKVASKHIAYEVAQKNPDDVDKFTMFVDQALSALDGQGQPIDIAVNALVTYLLDSCDDEIIASDLGDLLKMVLGSEGIVLELDNKDLNKILEKVKIMLTGMKAGLSLSRDILRT